MADKLFMIADVAPLRGAAPFTQNPLYHSLPFDLTNSKDCYFQPWQTDDSTTLQVWSDWVPEIKWYDYYTGDLIYQPVFTAIPSAVQGQTFLIYNAVINFADLGAGRFYAEVTYTNDDDEIIIWTFNPVSVEADQPDTILFEYTNSENNFSVIFETGIVFKFRVEGTIQLFKPSFNSVIYNDINENTTLLYGLPYRLKTLFVANQAGVPDWVADKVNRIMACDQVSIEGTPYTIAEGAKWEEKRAEEYDKIGLQIDIQEVENKFLDKLTLGPNPDDNTIIIVSKSIVFNNKGANFSIPGVFKDKSLLDCITLYFLNDPFIPFTFSVSLNADSSDPFYSDDVTSEDLDDDGPLPSVTFTIRKAFKEPVTLYLSDWAEGMLANVCVLYHQYDAPPISGSINPYKSLGVGAVVEYSPPVGTDLSVDFNLGTGLGNIDTDWYGWAICDGRNGTPDKGGITTRGYKATYPDPVTGDPVTDYNTLEDTGGADDVKMALENLIEHDHGTDMYSNKARSGGAIGGQGPDKHGSVTDKAGSPDPVPMITRNKYIVGLYVKKINA